MEHFGIRFNNSKGITKLSSLKSGIRKTDMKTEKDKSIFAKLDKDNNGVIDKNELKTLKSIKQKENGNISNKAFSDFANGNDLGDVKKQEFINFLGQANESSKDVIETNNIQNGENQQVGVNYADGHQEIYNIDGSRESISKDADGNTTSKMYSAFDVLTSETFTDTLNNTTTLTNYENDGETVASSIITDQFGFTTTINFSEGLPATKEVSQGSTTTFSSFNEEGSEQIDKIIENKGLPIEKTTEFTYNENGTITENIQEFSQNTTRITDTDKNPISEHIEQNNGAIIDRNYDELGAFSEKYVNNGVETNTNYNSDGMKLSQTKTVDGKTYSVEYDGEGNTKGIIVQNGELPSQIAEKFGCSTNELLELNSDILKGHKGFKAGAEIRVPGEIDPDSAALTNRKSKREVIADYKKTEARINAEIQEANSRKDVKFDSEFNSYEEIAKDLFKQEGITNPTKNQMKLRIEGLKNSNPNCIDGELSGKNITAGVNDDLFSKFEMQNSKAVAEPQLTDGEITLEKQKAKDVLEQLDVSYISDSSITEILNTINTPEALNELNNLLENLEGGQYKGDDMFSPVEKYMQQRFTNVDWKHGGVRKDNKFMSVNGIEKQIETWIENGTLKGDDAINAQARKAARMIADGSLQFSNTERVRGYSAVKDPFNSEDPKINAENAQKVYAKVNDLLAKEGIDKILESSPDYTVLDRREVDAVLAKNNVIIGAKKQEAAADLIKTSADKILIFDGDKKENFKSALSTIKSAEDLKGIQNNLKEYCEANKLDATAHNGDYLQTVIYEEFSDYETIHKFNESLIKNGAYTPEQAAALRADMAYHQLQEGGFDDINSAIGYIEDKAALQKLEAKVGNLESVLYSKLNDKTDVALVLSQLASKGLLSNEKSATIAKALITNSDYNVKAQGYKCIINTEIAKTVDYNLIKENGTRLEKELNKFNKEKHEYIEKSKNWDVAGLGLVNYGTQYISEKYAENTDMSDNLYLEAKTATPLTLEQKAGYEKVYNELKANYDKMLEGYQDSNDSHGIMSKIANETLESMNIGTTQDVVEARLEHDKETLRLLNLAKDGKLVGLDGIPVSFEAIYEERMGQKSKVNTFSTAGIDEIKETLNITSGNKVKYDANTAKDYEALQNKAKQIAAAEIVKDSLGSAWTELAKATDSNDSLKLSTAIVSSLRTLGRLDGQNYSLTKMGMKISDSGAIVKENGTPITNEELRDIANKLKTGMAGYASLTFGTDIDPNLNSEDIISTLDSKFDSQKSAYIDSYKQTTGQIDADTLIEKYNSTINKGTAALEIGYLAVISVATGGAAAPAALGAFAGTATFEITEKTTSKNGMTGEGFMEVMENSATSAVTMGAADLAGHAAKGMRAFVATKTGSKLVQNSAAIITDFGVNFGTQQAISIIKDNSPVDMDKAIVYNILSSLAGHTKKQNRIDAAEIQHKNLMQTQEMQALCRRVERRGLLGDKASDLTVNQLYDMATVDDINAILNTFSPEEIKQAAKGLGLDANTVLQYFRS